MRLSVIGITVSAFAAVLSMDYQYKAKTAGRQIGEYTMLEYAATLKQQYINLQARRAGVQLDDDHQTVQKAPVPTHVTDQAPPEHTDPSRTDFNRHTAAGFTSDCWVQDGRKRCKIAPAKE